MFNKQKTLGLLAYYIAQLLKITLRTKVVTHSNYNCDTQYLFAFWHGKQFLPVLELVKHKTKLAALVSPSRDGNMLSVWLEKLGYIVLRGSSRDDNIKSLKQMLRVLKQGVSLGFGVDGPIGPAFKIKPGIAYMAQKLNIAIVPIGSSFATKKIFDKAWDKYEIPKPFSKAVFYLGDPTYITKESDLEEANKMLEQKINAAEAKAIDLL